MGNFMAQYKSLTRDEKKLVTNGWSNIRTDMFENGNALFVSMLTDYPKLGRFFPFRSPNEPSFKRHISVFMAELDRVVRSIEDPHDLVDILTTIGTTHLKRNISKDDYAKMKNSLVKMFRERLGKTCDRNMEKAFAKALSVMFTFISSASAAERAELEKQ